MSGTRWNELRELTRVRTLSFTRQLEAVFWVFAFPMILAGVLGFAFQENEPAPTEIGVLEAHADHSLVERLRADERVEVATFSESEAAALALRSGKIHALLVDPSGETPEVRLDPMRPESEVARLRVLVAAGALEAELIEVDEVKERGSRYVDFLFPGLLGMNLMGTGLWAIGFAVADLWQRKVLKRMLVTPMRRSSFLASFLLSRLVFLAAEVLALGLFGAFVLDVPFRGGLLGFSLLSLLGAIAFSGLGLLIASRVKTIEGVSGMLNLAMIPMWLGSGVFFSYERFPEFIQPVLRLLPLTALNDALRATMLDGESLASLAPELAVLVLWTVLPFFLALKIFRWA